MAVRMASRIIVARPRISDSVAARLLALVVVISANCWIMGLIVWKSLPPTSSGALMAHRPVMKVKMVTAKRLGSSTGSTTRRRIVHWLAPMLRAASTVWKSTARMALRRKIMWFEVHENVITNSTAQ